MYASEENYVLVLFDILMDNAWFPVHRGLKTIGLGRAVIYGLRLRACFNWADKMMASADKKHWNQYASSGSKCLVAEQNLGPPPDFATQYSQIVLVAELPLSGEVATDN